MTMNFEKIEADLNQMDLKAPTIDDDSTRERIIETIGAAKKLATGMDESSIPHNCLHLLNERAMQVLPAEIRSFIERNPGLKERAFILVSELKTANDLIYASLFQPYKISQYGLPEDLLELFKQDNETRTELISVGKCKHLSDTMNDFCSSFPLKKDVCKLPWSVLDSNLTEMKLNDKEKRMIVKEIWAKQSELRQELTTSDFPGPLIEELEAMSEEKRNSLGRSEIEGYKAKYELTNFQLTVLNRLIRKSMSFFGPSGKWVSRLGKGKEFVALVEEAYWFLFEGKANQSEAKSTIWPKLLQSLDLCHDKDFDDKTKKQIKEHLEQTLELRNVMHKPPFETDEKMIAVIDNGRALHGLCLGINVEHSEEPVYYSTASKPLFNRPELSNVMEIGEKPREKNFYFSNGADAEKFKKVVFEMGLVEAGKLVNRFKTSLDNSALQSESSSSITALAFYSCPMISFEFETEHLTLTRQALDSLEDIDGTVEAGEFLDSFGSHFLNGSQRIGGIACNSIEIMLPHNELNNRLVKFAEELMERSHSEWKFQQRYPPVTEHLDHSFSQDSSAVQVHCKFEMDNRGPPISKFKLFQEVVKYDFSDWHVIERNVSHSSLFPIWKWIAKQHPEMKKQVEFLRDSWLQRVKAAETIDLVANEIRKTVRQNREQVFEETKNKIASLLEHFSEIGTQKQLEDHVLVKELEKFFGLMNTFEALADNSKEENPWVIYVAKRNEFFGFLDYLAKQVARGAILTNSFTFLRNALDDNILSTLEKSGCPIDDTVRKLIEVSEEESKKMLAFKDRLKDIRIANLANFLKKSLEESRQDQSMLQWKFGSLIEAALRAEDVSNPERSALYSLLTGKFNWSEGRFQYELKSNSFLLLIEEIEQLHETAESNKASGTSLSARIEEMEWSETVVPVEEDDNAKKTTFCLTNNENKNPQDTQVGSVDPEYGVPAKRLNPKDPKVIQRQFFSKSKGKKTFFDFLTDYPETSDDGQLLNNLKKMLVQCLRNRLNLNMLFEKANEANIAPYDVLLELADDFGPAGLHEMFLLLLERRLMVPIFNPLTCEHYLTMLSEVPYGIDSAKPPIMLGTDTSLCRVAVISFCQPCVSYAAELLSNLFHIESFHKVKKNEDPRTEKALAIDLGIGFLDAAVASSECSNSQVMIAHVLGDIEKATNFIKEFADILLVEDEIKESRSFHAAVQSLVVDRLIGDDTKILVWTPSARGFICSTEDENKQKYGVSFLHVKSPLVAVLINRLRTEVAELMLKIDESERSSVKNCRRMKKSLVDFELLGKETYSIRGLVPFNVESKLRENLKSVKDTRNSFLLQRNFREQYTYEDIKNENRLEKDKVIQVDLKINECHIKRQKDSTKVGKISLLKFFVDLLKNKDQSVRVMALRQLEHSLSARTEQELRTLQEKIDLLYKVVVGGVSNASKPSHNSDRETNKKLYEQAKINYREAMLHLEHLWRELSHLYVANPKDYNRFPELAAQHLLDGFSIELLDGDANLMNLQWIEAVLSVLNKRIGTRNRVFVLSIMGVQSSGKSTLLNTMFGIKMRTSVGQCTRGINMQLIPVDGRKEYDYVLVLDTEGTRSPDFHGMVGNEKRDNRMATLSILLADATIVVNPGENDAAVKEILPVVLLAYQGSKLAEDNGGRLSSMMFFVYNRIDVGQKEKLTNIIQSLANSLMEAFKTVGEMGGRITNHEKQTNCLFRHFKLDASNSSESDVRILGQNKKSFTPPENVPDPGYGEALVEFREHIHRRVTETRDGTEWSGRTPLELSKYLHQIWHCICTADFNLQFAHVLERSAFDLLEADYQRIKHEFSSECHKLYGELRKTMIETQSIVQQSDQSPSNDGTSCEMVQSKFLESISLVLSDLDKRVIDTTSAKGREKWKSVYQTYWETYKDQQKDYWRQRIKYSFDTIFLYDQGVEKLKKSMRQEISDMYQATPPERNYSDGELETKFKIMMSEYKKKVNEDYPSLDVSKKIKTLYTTSNIIKKHHAIDVYNTKLETFAKSLMEDVQLSSWETSLKNSWIDKLANGASFLKKGLVSFFSVTEKNPADSFENLKCSKEISKNLSVCLKCIHEKTTETLAGVACYDDSVVLSMIEKTDQILMDLTTGPIEYTYQAVAHAYARVVIEASLKQIQYSWEKNNSVPARFNQPSNIEELRQFFFMVARGANKMKLFGLLIKQKFADLGKAFEAEMIAQTIKAIKQQNWLYDFKSTQNYMDEFLVQLIDDDKVPDLITYVSEPKKLLDEVLHRVILEIAKKELSTDIEWERFTNALKTVVRNSTADVLQAKNNRATEFVHVLKHSSLHVSEILAQSLAVDLGNEYNELDEESDEDFKKACETDIIEVINKQSSPTTNSTFARTIVELVMKQLREENAASAMPRCDACCPWCRSMCTLKAGHDPESVKHDTIHQPAGLGGVHFMESKKLQAIMCSIYRDSHQCRTTRNGNEIKFLWRQWETIFPEWIKPHSAQDWPLREYIFYNYHQDFANRYGYKPCEDMIETYNRDLKSIKLRLEEDRKGPKIF